MAGSIETDLRRSNMIHLRAVAGESVDLDVKVYNRGTTTLATLTGKTITATLKQDGAQIATGTTTIVSPVVTHNLEVNFTAPNAAGLYDIEVAVFTTGEAAPEYPVTGTLTVVSS